MCFGKTCDGIKQEKDLVPLIPKMFRSRDRAERGAFLGSRWVIGSRSYNDRSRQDVFGQSLVDELIHFPAAFADQGNDDAVRFHASSERTKEGRFTDTRPGKQAHSLTLTDR